MIVSQNHKVSSKALGKLNQLKQNVPYFVQCMSGFLDGCVKNKDNNNVDVFNQSCIWALNELNSVYDPTMFDKLLKLLPKKLGLLISNKIIDICADNCKTSIQFATVLRLFKLSKSLEFINRFIDGMTVIDNEFCQQMLRIALAGKGIFRFKLILNVIKKIPQLSSKLINTIKTEFWKQTDTLDNNSFQKLYLYLLTIQSGNGINNVEMKEDSRRDCREKTNSG